MLDNENNLLKLERGGDTNLTINNYKDKNKNDTKFPKTIKSVDNIVSTVVDFVHNTVLSPAQKLNIYNEHKIKEFRDIFNEKASAIPPENLTLPRANIFGYTAEALKYNLDEDNLKNMFMNILLSEINNQTQYKVLPSYIEIVKQLSKEDAEFLKLLYQNNNKISRILVNPKNTWEVSTSYITYYTNTHEPVFQLINPLVSGILRMHNLIKSAYNANPTLEQEKEYSDLIKYIEKTSTNSQMNSKFIKSIILPTAIGKNFIDICLS